MKYSSVPTLATLTLATCTHFSDTFQRALLSLKWVQDYMPNNSLFYGGFDGQRRGNPKKFYSSVPTLATVELAETCR